jgi:hypothetical protein
MKTITLAALITLSASAASADCLSIKAYDLRQACLAQQRQDPRDCTGWDERELCRQRAGQRDQWGRRQDGFDIRR